MNRFLSSVAIFLALACVVSAFGPSRSRHGFGSKSSADCAECSLDVPHLIQWHGYPAESHFAPTEDGFTLGLHRIPYSPNNRSAPGDAPRPVVLLQHGLLDSSFTWVANYPNESLAYILADAGWDVWLGNNRGNFYSPPPTGSNWQFTWDDMAKYDVPAQINYILSVTGARDLGYVGHSEGTTQMFAAYTVVPDLASKVNMYVAMAPVAYVYNQKSPLMTALANSDLSQILLALGVTDFLAESWVNQLVGELVCAPGEMTTPYCEDVIFLICGQDPEWSHNLNSSRMEIYMSHTSAGTSLYNMIHWEQAVRNDTFSMFDWGTPALNLQHYNQTTPPLYSLAAINSPVALFTAGNDELADPQDVLRLESELTPGVMVYIHDEPNYEHLDFSWGMDCATRIYPDVLEMLIKGHNHEFKIPSAPALPAADS